MRISPLPWVLAALLLLQPWPALPQSAAFRPVMLQSSEEVDACPSLGAPTGLNPRGDNFLALKAAPNLKAKRIAKIGPQQVFLICDRTRDGAWLGVLLPGAKQKFTDCGGSSPVGKRQRYRGPCMQGWVAARYVQVIAG